MDVWRRSYKCSDISRDDTKRACAPVLALYKERGAAARKTEINADLATLRPILARGRPEHADPQAAALAALTGLDEDVVRRLISALLVLTIEVGAIGGSIMAASPSVRHAPPQMPAAAPVAPVEPPQPAPVVFQPALAAPATPERSDHVPSPPAANDQRSYSQAEALEDLRELHRAGERPTNQTLAERWGRSTSKTHRWVNEWVRAGHAHRRKAGGEVLICAPRVRLVLPTSTTRWRRCPARQPPAASAVRVWIP